MVKSPSRAGAAGAVAATLAAASIAIPAPMARQAAHRPARWNPVIVALLFTGGTTLAISNARVTIAQARTARPRPAIDWPTPPRAWSCRRAPPMFRLLAVVLLLVAAVPSR